MAELSSKTLFVLAGPTAVGKTAAAIQLARALDTSIVSADSRQCYREMSIGTAKPSDEELAAVKHYFINSHSIQEEISAASFEKQALGYLKEIYLEKNTAVVCGGTGLYIKALCEGLDEMPSVDDSITRDIQSSFDDHGLSWLQEQVRKEDPLFFSGEESQNPARLMRALGFVRSTGISIVQYRSGQKKIRPFHIIKIGLGLNRELLYERINKRVEHMADAGLLEEARGLYPQRKLKALQTVGYSEIFDFMEGRYSLPEAIEKVKQHSRNYAKRQLTWFKKDPEFHWFRADDADLLEKMLSLIDRGQ